MTHGLLSTFQSLRWARFSSENVDFQKNQAFSMPTMVSSVDSSYAMH